MVLKKSDVERITFGALKITENDGHFDFFRFTDEQIAVYEKENLDFHKKAFGTASVMLDFYTNSRTLSFNFATESKAGPNLKFAFIDAWVDGMMVAHLGDYSIEPRGDRAELLLGEGEKRVTLYLPSVFRTTLSQITLEDGASLRPAEKKYKALILGDSITHGYCAHFPSLNYANTVIRDLELDAVNQAIGGEVFRPSILGSAPLFEPDVVTVALGTNNRYNQKEADEYFKILAEHYPRARRIYISPIWRADNGPDFFKAIEDYEALARSYGMEIISGLQVLHHLPDMFTDGLHPNDLGYSQYSELLIKKLREIGF